MSDGFRPVGGSHKPLRETVTEEIRQAILSGRLRPGERLVESRLATELGVSRNPIREALRTLASEGFVEIVPRHGASVVHLTAREGEELLEVREPLEALAARLASRRITPSEIDALWEIWERGAAAAERGELDNLPALNTEFHAAIVAAAENEYLAQFVKTLRDKIQWVYTADVKARAHNSWGEHRELLEAIAAHDADKASEIAANHIRNARRAFTAGYRNDGA